VVAEPCQVHSFRGAIAVFKSPEVAATVTVAVRRISVISAEIQFSVPNLQSPCVIGFWITGSNICGLAYAGVPILGNLTEDVRKHTPGASNLSTGTRKRVREEYGKLLFSIKKLDLRFLGTKVSAAENSGRTV
jgi:hypothetical protein